MKQFIAFVRKEFYHIFRDNRTLLVILGMPVVEILLFGFAINMEVQDIRVAVYDPPTPPTHSLMALLNVSSRMPISIILGKCTPWRRWGGVDA